MHNFAVRSGLGNDEQRGQADGRPAEKDVIYGRRFTLTGYYISRFEFFAAAIKRAILFLHFISGAVSTALETSTPNGRKLSMTSETFSSLSPPAI